MKDKTNEYDQKHNVIMGTDPHLTNHNPAIFCLPKGTVKFNKSLQVDKKPW